MRGVSSSERGAHQGAEPYLTGGHIQQGSIDDPPDIFIPGSLETALWYP